ncbi:hypothetical protein Ahy_B01g053469 [Arachis hypogaea]|uniref:Uncharacterized protein n=1 Tax=Arachis hypogaea TaxID=3818 RepID=A0A445ARU8_ARAHY|nr:hypothetical protein Ahy_B01g053469 [Arachis hypogaea]
MEALFGGSLNAACNRHPSSHPSSFRRRRRKVFYSHRSRSSSPLFELSLSLSLPVVPAPPSPSLPFLPHRHSCRLNLNLEGVLLARVPAARGFDVVFNVTLKNSSSNVKKIWSLLNVI